MDHISTIIAIYALVTTLVAMFIWNAFKARGRAMQAMERTMETQEREISRLNMENVHYEGLFGPKKME